jgi:hypothetical protein
MSARSIFLSKSQSVVRPALFSFGLSAGLACAQRQTHQSMPLAFEPLSRQGPFEHLGGKRIGDTEHTEKQTRTRRSLIMATARGPTLGHRRAFQ